MKKFKVIASDVCAPFIHPASYFCITSAFFEKFFGEKEEWITIQQGDCVKWAVYLPVFERNGKIALEKLLGEREFYEKTLAESERTIIQLEIAAVKISKMNLSALSNAELVTLYRRLFASWRKMNLWGHMVNLPDFEHFLLSNRIMKFLEKRIGETNVSITVAEAFSILATSNKRGKLQQQDFDFLTLLAKIQDNVKARELFKKEPSEINKGLLAFPEIKRAISTHTAKYKWLQFHYDGPTVLGESYFVESLASAVKAEEIAARKELEKITTHEKHLLARQSQLNQQLKLSQSELHAVEVAKSLAFLKNARKESVFQACCDSYSLIREFARRLSTSPKLVKFMTLDELEESLEKGQFDEAEVNKRTKSHVLTFQNGNIEFHTGKQAEKLLAAVYEDEVSQEVKDIKGTPAFPGVVKGIVKIVNSESQMKGFQKGNVLVSAATNPNIVSVMKIAGAIVTDEGGITCHAAIVSRELKVPCVIGTKVATKWLKDGDRVEVDATKGIVKKI